MDIGEVDWQCAACLHAVATGSTSSIVRDEQGHHMDDFLSSSTFVDLVGLAAREAVHKEVRATYWRDTGS